MRKSRSSKKEKGKTYLVITRAENKLGVGVVIHQAFYNLTLVDGNRPDFEIHLAHED